MLTDVRPAFTDLVVMAAAVGFGVILVIADVALHR